MDLNTLEKIRAEVEKMKKEDDFTKLPVDGKCTGSHVVRANQNSIYNSALTGLLHYLDTEIANATQASR